MKKKERYGMNNKKLSEQALEARREYYRNYYRDNKDKILEYQKEWRKDNPDKVKQYMKNYWENQRQEQDQNE